MVNRQRGLNNVVTDVSNGVGIKPIGSIGIEDCMWILQNKATVRIHVESPP